MIHTCGCAAAGRTSIAPSKAKPAMMPIEQADGLGIVGSSSMHGPRIGRGGAKSQSYNEGNTSARHPPPIAGVGTCYDITYRARERRQNRLPALNGSKMRRATMATLA